MLSQLIEKDVNMHKNVKLINTIYLNNILNLVNQDKSDMKFLLQGQYYTIKEVKQIIHTTYQECGFIDLFYNIQKQIAIPKYLCHELKLNKYIICSYFRYYAHLIKLSKSLKKIQTCLWILWTNLGSDRILTKSNQNIQASCLLQLAKYISIYYEIKQYNRSDFICGKGLQNFQPHCNCIINNKTLCLLLCKHYMLGIELFIFHHKEYDNQDLHRAFQCIYERTIFYAWNLVELKQFIQHIKDKLQTIHRKQSVQNLRLAQSLDYLYDYYSKLNNNKSPHTSYVVIYNPKLLLLHILFPKSSIYQSIRCLINQIA